MIKGLARDQYGHTGLVKCKPECITHTDGSMGFSYVGRKVWPLRFLGKAWRAHSPRWIIFFW